MAKGAVSAVAAWCVVVLVVAAQIHETAASCDPGWLKPCEPAVLNGSPPSEMCCTMLKEQQWCLCTYIRNPRFATYINNPNAKKIAPACGLTYPTCD